jgi:hypothetical protein
LFRHENVRRLFAVKFKRFRHVNEALDLRPDAVRQHRRALDGQAQASAAGGGVLRELEVAAVRAEAFEQHEQSRKHAAVTKNEHEIH